MADSKVVKFFKKLGQKFGRKIDVSKDLKKKIRELNEIVDKKWCNYSVLEEIKEKIKEIYKELEKDVKEQEATGNYKKFCDEFEKRTNELYNLKIPGNLDYNSYIKAFEKTLKLFILECKKYLVAESRFQKVANFTNKEIESMLDKKSKTNDLAQKFTENVNWKAIIGVQSEDDQKVESYRSRKNDDYKKYADLGLSLIHKVSYNRVEHVVKPLLRIFTDAIIEIKKVKVKFQNIDNKIAKLENYTGSITNYINDTIGLLNAVYERLGIDFKANFSNFDYNQNLLEQCNKNIENLTNIQNINKKYNTNPYIQSLDSHVEKINKKLSSDKVKCENAYSQYNNDIKKMDKQIEDISKENNLSNLIQKYQYAYEIYKKYYSYGRKKYYIPDWPEKSEYRGKAIDYLNRLKDIEKILSKIGQISSMASVKNMEFTQYLDSKSSSNIKENFDKFLKEFNKKFAGPIDEEIKLIEGRMQEAEKKLKEKKIKKLNEISLD